MTDVWVGFFSSPFCRRKMVHVFGTLEKGKAWLAQHGEMDEARLTVRIEDESVPKDVGVDYGTTYWLEQHSVR